MDNMNKKAMELPLNMIVVMAVLLMATIMIIFFFLKGFGGGASSLSSLTPSATKSTCDSKCFQFQQEAFAIDTCSIDGHECNTAGARAWCANACDTNYDCKATVAGKSASLKCSCTGTAPNLLCTASCTGC